MPYSKFYNEILKLEYSTTRVTTISCNVFLDKSKIDKNLLSRAEKSVLLKTILIR